MLGQFNTNFNNIQFYNNDINLLRERFTNQAKDAPESKNDSAYTQNEHLLIEYHDKFNKLTNRLFSSPIACVQNEIKNVLKETDIKDIMQNSQRYIKEKNLLISNIIQAKDIRKFKDEFLKFKLVSTFLCLIAKNLKNHITSNEKLELNTIREIKKILNTFNELISLRDTILKNNVRLVFHIVKKLYNNIRKQCDYNYDDLVQIGMVFLIKSIDFFDPEKGFKASTYFTECIRNGIISTLRKQKAILSHETSQTLAKIYQAQSELEKELKRAPLDEEIRVKLNMNKQSWDSLQTKLKRMLNLDDLKLSKNLIPNKSMQTPYELACIEERQAFVSEVLSYMYQKDAELLRLHYGLDGNKDGINLEKCGQIMNLSRERMRQIKVRGEKMFKLIALSLKANLTPKDEETILRNLERIAKIQRHCLNNNGILFNLHFVQKFTKSQIAKILQKSYMAIENAIISLAKRYAQKQDCNYSLEEIYSLSLKIEKEYNKRK